MIDQTMCLYEIGTGFRCGTTPLFQTFVVSDQWNLERITLDCAVVYFSNALNRSMYSGRDPLGILGVISLSAGCYMVKHVPVPCIQNVLIPYQRSSPNSEWLYTLYRYDVNYKSLASGTLVTMNNPFFKDWLFQFSLNIANKGGLNDIHFMSLQLQS
jgi:hypothetical protein